MLNPATVHTMLVILPKLLEKESIKQSPEEIIIKKKGKKKTIISIQEPTKTSKRARAKRFIKRNSDSYHSIEEKIGLPSTPFGHILGQP